MVTVDQMNQLSDLELDIYNYIISHRHEVIHMKLKDLSTDLHVFHLDGVLNGLHAHLALATIRDVVGDLLDEGGIFTLIGMQHGFTDCSHYLLFVESNDASVALYYCLNHYTITFTIND